MEMVDFTLKSSKDWSSVEKADKLAHIFVSENDFILPEKFDQSEPEKFVFSPENFPKLHEFWTSKSPGVLFKRKKPYLSWLTLMISHGRRFNEILSGFDDRYFKKEDKITKFVSFAKQLYKWGNIDHGYICHRKDWQAKNRFEKPIEIKGKPLMGGGNRLGESLPGIYWVNFFGPTYVNFFGKDKFTLLHAYAKEELPDGGFLVMTAQSPFDYDKSETKKLEKEIIAHLGSDAFFDKSNPTKQCQVPELIKEYASKPVEVIAYDPIKDTIPDVNLFIEEVPQLAKELLNQLNDNGDYSIESLDLLDKFILKKSCHDAEPWKKEKGRRLLKQITAYYGEVRRRHLKGNWSTKEGSGGDLHPVIVFTAKNRTEIEYPFPHVIKFWISREGTDGLSIR
jgi:hypothetical protein